MTPPHMTHLLAREVELAAAGATPAAASGRYSYATTWPSPIVSISSSCLG